MILLNGFSEGHLKRLRSPSDSQSPVFSLFPMEQVSGEQLSAALSLGVPIITTRGKSTSDQLVDGVNVLFADTATAIANRIDLLLEDMALADSMAENSKKLSSSFSWEQIASDHIKAYERLNNY